MGFINQLIRELKEWLRGSGKKKKKRQPDEPVQIHKSWNKPQQPAAQPKIVRTHPNKKKVPGLLQIKRVLAGVLLLINFVFSQFLLLAVGSDGFATFLIFMGNSFVIADYLWKTRRKPE